MRERIFAQDVSSCFNCLFSAIPLPVVRQSCPPPTRTLAGGLALWSWRRQGRAIGAEGPRGAGEVWRLASGEQGDESCREKGRGEIRPSMLSGECLSCFFECSCSCGLGFLLFSFSFANQRAVI